jgi:hypothetical protein
MTDVYCDHYVSMFDAWKASGLEFKDGEVVDRQGRIVALEMGIKLLHGGAHKVRKLRGVYDAEGIPIIQL